MVKIICSKKPTAREQRLADKQERQASRTVVFAAGCSKRSPSSSYHLHRSPKRVRKHSRNPFLPRTYKNGGRNNPILVEDCTPSSESCGTNEDMTSSPSVSSESSSSVQSMSGFLSDALRLRSTKELIYKYREVVSRSSHLVADSKKKNRELIPSQTPVGQKRLDRIFRRKTKILAARLNLWSAEITRSRSSCAEDAQLRPCIGIASDNASTDLVTLAETSSTDSGPTLSDFLSGCSGLASPSSSDISNQDPGVSATAMWHLTRKEDASTIIPLLSPFRSVSLVADDSFAFDEEDDDSDRSSAFIFGHQLHTSERHLQDSESSVQHEDGSSQLNGASSSESSLQVEYLPISISPSSSQLSSFNGLPADNSLVGACSDPDCALALCDVFGRIQTLDPSTPLRNQTNLPSVSARSLTSSLSSMSGNEQYYTPLLYDVSGSSSLGAFSMNSKSTASHSFVSAAASPSSSPNIAPLGLDIVQASSHGTIRNTTQTDLGPSVASSSTNDWISSSHASLGDTTDIESLSNIESCYDYTNDIVPVDPDLMDSESKAGLCQASSPTSTSLLSPAIHSASQAMSTLTLCALQVACTPGRRLSTAAISNVSFANFLYEFHKDHWPTHCLAEIGEPGARNRRQAESARGHIKDLVSCRSGQCDVD